MGEVSTLRDARLGRRGIRVPHETTTTGDR